MTVLYSSAFLYAQDCCSRNDAMAKVQDFETFVRDYQDMVFSIAVRIAGNHADAEDIAQEAFLKAFARFDELKESRTAGGWLKTVATNLSINHVQRYRNRYQFFSEREDLPEVAVTLPVSQETRETLDSALLKLPHAQRIPLVLFYFQELTYEEISSHLQVSLAKVKTDIYRGREALRKIMQIQ